MTLFFSDYEKLNRFYLIKNLFTSAETLFKSAKNSCAARKKTLNLPTLSYGRSSRVE